MDILLNISTLYRNTQKYLDSKLATYNLGSGQYIFLMIINENKGITAKELCIIGDFDKSTVNKAITKLIKEDFLITKNDDDDKRLKHLYLSDKANLIVNEFYQYRKELNYLLEYPENESLKNLAKKSRNLISISQPNMKISRMDKLNLVASRDNISTSLYASGCNFKCPYCNQRDLVFDLEDLTYLDNDEIYQYLFRRNKEIEMVVFTGGEAILQASAIDMITKCKAMGYKTKIETNGYFPEKLQYLIDNKLVDEIEMSLKSSFENYPLATGINNMDIDLIKKSLTIVKNAKITSNFKIVVYKELFDDEEIKKISKILAGSKRIVIENYKKTKNSIDKSLTPVSYNDLMRYQNILRKECFEVEISGGCYVSSS